MNQAEATAPSSLALARRAEKGFRKAVAEAIAVHHAAGDAVLAMSNGRLYAVSSRFVRDIETGRFVSGKAVGLSPVHCRTHL